MYRVAVVGVVVLVLGLVGYAVGAQTAYPGRAFSVTAIMAGIGLLGLGRSESEVAS
ncbi:hypothetical protein [Salinarchaeum laminariae]|uniref:hypothetical protein n=1 Tax=Salinarchaeum laminariae TaxID=869888 RepID=UPI0020BE303D|nr:hypothetical protein [Salinarchaeum laminariae]